MSDLHSHSCGKLSRPNTQRPVDSTEEIRQDISQETTGHRSRKIKRNNILEKQWKAMMRRIVLNTYITQDHRRRPNEYVYRRKIIRSEKSGIKSKS